MPAVTTESSAQDMFKKLNLAYMLQQNGVDYDISQAIFSETAKNRLNIDEQEALVRLTKAYKGLDKKTRSAIYEDVGLYFSIASKLGFDIRESDGINKFIQLLNRLTDHFQICGIFEYFSPVVDEIGSQMHMNINFRREA